MSDNDVLSNIIVLERNNLSSSIEITHGNTMEGQFNIKQIYKNNLLSSIQIKKPLDKISNIIIRRSKENEIESSLIVYIKKTAKLRSYIDVAKTNNLSCSIDININNEMTGIFDIMPRPTIIHELIPIKDAFVREGVPYLNYGTEEDILVGYSEKYNEKYRGFLQFNINEFPSGKYIKQVRLKLYNIKDKLPQNIQLQKLNGYWEELGITWSNQPDADTILNTTTINKLGNVYIDVTNIFIDWYENEIYNYGLLINAEDENFDQYLRFGSKESSHPPVLEIEYYDDSIKNNDRSWIDNSIIIRRKDYKDILGNIEIQSYYSTYDIPSLIKLSYQIECSILVKKDNLESLLTVRRSNDDNINSNITIRNKNYSIINSNLTISRLFINNYIYVLYRDNLSSNIIVKQIDNNELDTNIIISRKHIDCSIYVRERNDLISNISIRKTENNSLNTNIIISKPYIDSLINVLERNNLNSSIVINQYDSSDINCIVVVIRKEIDCNIQPRIKTDINSTITVQQNINNDIDSIIIIKRTEKDNINCNIKLNFHSDLSCFIHANSGYLLGNIIVRQNVNNNLNSFIGVTKYNDVNCSIDIVYASKKDLNSTILPRIKEELESNISVIRKELVSDITIRRSQTYNINCTIEAKQINDLECSISSVYSSNINCTITARVKWADDLITTIEIVGEDEQSYSYVFIM